MKFIPHGAAREVTGTCHELQIGGKRILLDCGLFQGHRSETVEKNATFTFDPRSIDAVLLSHAHMDHAGRIPLLYKKGFTGPVFCTYATMDLSAVMLKDSGYIQEKDEEYFRKKLRHCMLPTEGPLYTQQDAIDCMTLFRGCNYGDWVEVTQGVRARFLDAGHIIGAAMLVIEAQEEGKTLTIGFSGDLGRSSLPILRDPEKMPQVDVLICESTYGNRNHEDITQAQDRLLDVVVRTAKRGGKIIIPAFSLERTQEIIYDLHILWDEKRLPDIPVVVDSPLASAVTEVFMKHPECYDADLYEQFLKKQRNPFRFGLVRYTESVEESKALNGTPGPMIIMAASGMCEAGRIRHHLRNEIENAKNTILAVGFMAEGTLGHKIVDPKITEVKIFDDVCRKNAEIVFIDAYSGHAGKDDLDAYIANTPGMRQIILVHGEESQMIPFGERIGNKGIKIYEPKREEEIILG